MLSWADNHPDIAERAMFAVLIMTNQISQVSKIFQNSQAYIFSSPIMKRSKFRKKPNKNRYAPPYAAERNHLTNPTGQTKISKLDLEILHTSRRSLVA